MHKTTDLQDKCICGRLDMGLIYYSLCDIKIQNTFLN